MRTWIPTLAFTAALTACAAQSPFTLPEGSADAGKKVFVDSDCSFCHPVDGVEELPAPVANPPVPVRFGRKLSMTDGEIVQSIIDPDHFVSPAYPEGFVTRDGESRMPTYRNTLTVQQLIDLVAFLRDPR